MPEITFTVEMVESERMRWQYPHPKGTQVCTEYVVIDTQGRRWRYTQTYVIGLYEVWRGPRQDVQKL